MSSSETGYSKILLVDDIANNLFVLSEIIRLHFPGAELLEAGSGAEALAIVNREPVDIILMDVQMPEMDGFETARLIHGRKKTSHIPIIFITAHDSDYSRMQTGLEAGGIDYLSKPINDEELVRLLALYQRFITRERQINSTVERVNQSLTNEIQERIRAEQTVRRLNAELESRVDQRTSELQKEIDERKKIEAQLKQSQAELTIVNLSLQEAISEVRKVNDAKSIFLASMSHEIRTPMNSILGFTELLIEGETDPQKKEKLEIIFYSGNFLLSLINDILDLSKIEAGKLEINSEVFSLSKLLCNIYNVMKVKADEKKIDLLMISFPDKDLWIKSDPKALSQILINLISNAIKFTDTGSVSIVVSHADNSLGINIIDTGIGIPVHKQAKIFEAFEQAHGSSREGTGLGLAITSRLVELLGGNLSLMSQEGKGSDFALRLPLPLQAAPNESPGKKMSDTQRRVLNSEELEKKLNELQVLVVDDNNLNLKLMASILKRQNISCDLAQSGKDALDLMRKKSYQIAILDIQMPDMDGIAVLAEMKKDPILKDIYVLALTANAMDGMEEEYRTLGFNHYLTKPLRAESLRAVFIAYLNQF